MRRRARPAALLAAALSVAALSLSQVPPAQAVRTAAPAPDQAGTSAGLAGSRDVTVVLAPPDRAALLAAALDPSGSAAVRAARVARLRPTSAARARVVATLRGLGLTVTGGTDWTVTAAAPPAAVGHALGSARSVDAASPWGHALPLRPGALARDATTVLGGDETRPAMRPYPTAAGTGRTTTAVAADGAYGSTGDTGAQLRAAYRQSSDGAPPAGAGGPTIATVQFSGWDVGSLRVFGRAAVGSDPVATGQYTAVAVAGARPDAADGYGGDNEVALDQESLLAVAPHARQRAYFAPNSDAGSIEALHRVAADATRPGDTGLVALSTSWGQCEAREDPSVLRAEEDAYEEIVAAGVTTFAATGDYGAFDCSSSGMTDNRLQVDYPSSSPVVVGVGGTSDPGPGERAWSSPTFGAPTQFQGMAGGGGPSALFGRPAYQAGLLPQFHRRLVPDIAADADNAPGADGRSHGFSGYSEGFWQSFGGTSLSAPLSAALLTDSLSSAGIRSGIGDIHGYLYGAWRSGGGTFRDVTNGNNLHWAAGRGYDLATGLGSPLWDALGPVLTRGPRVSAPAYSASRSVPVHVAAPPGAGLIRWLSGSSRPPCPATSGSRQAPTSVAVPRDGPQTLWVVGITAAGVCYYGRAQVVVDTVAPTMTSASASVVTHPGRPPLALFRWGGRDAGPSPSGLGGYDVEVLTPGRPLVYQAVDTRRTAIAFSAVPGATYYLFVHARDRAGNLSPTGSRRLVMPVDQTGLALRGVWSVTVGSTYYRGSEVYTSRRGPFASWRGPLRSASALLTWGPRNGFVDVYLDGRFVRRLDTFAWVTRYQMATPVVALATAGVHTVTLLGAGLHDPSSHGSLLQLDGLLPAS